MISTPTPSTCKICGNEYFRPPGSIYKVLIDGKQYTCCSYKCYTKALELKAKRHEEKMQRRYTNLEAKGESQT